MSNSFNALSTFTANGKEYSFYSLPKLAGDHNIDKLPFAQKILLENLLRLENGVDVTRSDIEALLNWDATAEPDTEIAFTPARVLLQDFTGVPAVVDLAAMREAVEALGGDAEQINPLSPVELVIDHSVQIDHYGTKDALDLNAKIEFQRNKERYQFLKWGQTAFHNFAVVPPSTGIVHQVNLEYLARVVFENQVDGKLLAYPDTLVGTDSHTTMINGVGVLGWGVGGIEAEAAMLGQPISMLIPQTVGFKLSGQLPEGATATDLVLTVVQMLREYGVVGKFVEFFGDGLDHLPVADRATIANMAPEYGATSGIFPIDDEVLRYLRLTGRDDSEVALVEAYAKAQGYFRTPGLPEARYSGLLSLDMSTVEPSLAGPKRPQDRVLVSAAKAAFLDTLAEMTEEQNETVVVEQGDEQFELKHGAVVIAAITSCTNTSNPAVMLGAGLLARNAAAKGLTVKPWVKTSLAPGSQVVTEYLRQADVLDDLESLGFNVVGYGCTTCIGNSGPLPPAVGDAVRNNKLVVASVLSGNRNFEGRVHADVKTNYLASPPLVVAYAIAGRMDIDLYNEPLGQDSSGTDVFLKDIWPSNHDIQSVVASTVNAKMFKDSYASVFNGNPQWNAVDAPKAARYEWQEDSTYIRNPPYFEGMGIDVDAVADIQGARCLALLGDSITTDHISPAGSISADSPAARYLNEQGVQKADFNSYGSRRGNHEVMMRGTFANVRLRNQLAPGTEGGWTTHIPSGEVMSIFDASMQYQENDTPLVVLGGKEYGTGSSRDWAAKGTLLLGVKAVLTESFERIHRSNLVGMGVLPLNYIPGESAESLGLTGHEVFDISGLENGHAKQVTITATNADGNTTTFQARVRLDTPKEVEYYQHGGILHYVLRQLAAKKD
ncbi:aconitate hydratase [Arenicella chitinivorans]|uniref:Aconitate hydratase n=1 Tax=Arenicella chitinivorans TaxID=1329800 RepID=A0A918VHP1_9GAMM|nr:aconitate hydratase AcnA [Arenicella chitinivorans]GGZ97526.1 aconitate hydratase [Arenicella chitinivorans]